MVKQDDKGLLKAPHPVRGLPLQQSNIRLLTSLSFSGVAHFLSTRNGSAPCRRGSHPRNLWSPSPPPPHPKRGHLRILRAKWPQGRVPWPSLSTQAAPWHLVPSQPHTMTIIKTRFLTFHIHPGLYGVISHTWSPSSVLRPLSGQEWCRHLGCEEAEPPSGFRPCPRPGGPETAEPAAQGGPFRLSPICCHVAGLLGLWSPVFSFAPRPIPSVCPQLPFPSSPAGSHINAPTSASDIPGIFLPQLYSHFSWDF